MLSVRMAKALWTSIAYQLLESDSNSVGVIISCDWSGMSHI